VNDPFLWNIGGALVKPKYVTLGMYVPNSLVLILLWDSQVFISPPNGKLGVQLPLRGDFMALSGC